MAYTYHDLKSKTVQELRDIAKDVQHDAVQGHFADEQRSPAAGALQGPGHRRA